MDCVVYPVGSSEVINIRDTVVGERKSTQTLYCANRTNLSVHHFFYLKSNFFLNNHSVFEHQIMGVD